MASSLSYGSIASGLASWLSYGADIPLNHPQIHLSARRPRQVMSHSVGHTQRFQFWVVILG